MAMREKLKKAFVAHAEGKLQYHLANVEVYLMNPVGIGEQPDIMEALESELAKVAHYDELLETARKHLD